MGIKYTQHEAVMELAEVEAKLKKLPVKAVAFVKEGDLPYRIAFPLVYNPCTRVVVGMANSWEEALLQAERSARTLAKKKQPLLFPE